MESFQELVHKMRIYQKAFFKRKRRNDLVAAKELEKQVDEALVDSYGGYAERESYSNKPIHETQEIKPEEVGSVEDILGKGDPALATGTEHNPINPGESTQSDSEEAPKLEEVVTGVDPHTGEQLVETVEADGGPTAEDLGQQSGGE